MKPGVVRFLHAHERVQVARQAGWPNPAKAATHDVYGWVYVNERAATRYASANARQGHVVTGPLIWEGHHVTLLVLGDPT